VLRLHPFIRCGRHSLKTARPPLATKTKRSGTLLPVLSFLPLVGPAVYLLLRPKTKA
jgi:hypothetical protein